MDFVLMVMMQLASFLQILQSNEQQSVQGCRMEL
jgi:hypothetical protein